MKLLLCLLSILLLSPSVTRAVDSQQIETKVQSDLDAHFSRIISKDAFVVQVNATVENVQEKRLVEGETMIQRSETAQVVVPPLPGFIPDTKSPQIVPPQQSRQVFKMVDVPTLKTLSISVTLDESIEESKSKKIEGFARSYLGSNYGSKGQLNMLRVKMIPQENSRGNPSVNWILYALGTIGALACLYMLLKTLAARRYPYQPFSSNLESQYQPINVRTVDPKELRENAIAAPKALALPSSSQKKQAGFPALPATEQFVDRRAKLLEVFLKSSDVFRLYFRKLSPEAQRELYAGLRGPAFDSLLEGLGISLPSGNEEIPIPSEEQMLFYEKNFQEFLNTNEWQYRQFFGFLQQLTHEQLLSLIKKENALVGAILIKFMSPTQSATVLSALSSTERTEILSQGTRLQALSTEELSSIETSVRAHANHLPKFIFASKAEDIEFWSQVLMEAPDQDAILCDLEQTRPELYPLLSKFRFKLDDAPSLPRPLVSKVLDGADNEQLALALSTCSRDVSDFLLAEVAPKRRELVQNQLVMLTGMPSDSVETARRELTKKFREVMA